MKQPLIAIAFLGLLFPALTTRAGVSADAPPMALVGATAIDPASDQIVKDSVILIRSGRITAIGSRQAIAIPRGTPVTHLVGKWIVPGFIDTHVHLAGRGTSRDNADFFGPRPTKISPSAIDEARARVAVTLARHLRSGTTTVVDVGGPAWVLALRGQQQAKPWPRIFAAGPIIGPKADIANHPQAPETSVGGGADEPLDPNEMRVNIGSPDEARAAVRNVAALKPDLIKLYMIPSEHTGLPFVKTLPWFQAAIDEAHKLHLRVTAHAMRADIAEAGVSMGLDMLAHGILDRPISPRCLETMRQRRIVMSTTLMVLEGPISVMTGKVSFIPPEEAWGDPAAIADLRAASELAHLAKYQAQRAVLRPGALEIAKANTRTVVNAGLPIAIGTDSGFLGIIHGPSIFHEFELLRQAGLTPMQVLRAASYGGAQYLSRTAELGSLSPGQRADLVVLEADPLADIANASHINAVMLAGRLWPAKAILGDRQ